MLAELAEVVVGVETRSQTHTAAVVDAGTGAVLARATVIADPDAYHPTCRLAEQHSGLRAWAMKGTAGCSADLARHLADELVVQLGPPKRPARRAGARSDPNDADARLAMHWPAPSWPSPRPVPSGSHRRCA
jgi:transposase